MPEENTKTTQPVPGENGTEPTPALGQEGQPQPAKVYTEEEFNRHMAAARRKWEAEAKKAAEEAAKRAQMDEAERLKAEKEELEAKLNAERAARLAAERRAALTGKVADPNAALKLLEDKHLNEDGSVDVDALLKDYPFLAAQPTQPAKPEPTPYPAQGRAPAAVKPKTPEQLAQEKAKDPLYQSL